MNNWAAVLCFVTLLVTIAIGLVVKDVSVDIKETNRLLATFHRIDVIKDIPGPLPSLKTIQPGSGSGHCKGCETCIDSGFVEQPSGKYHLNCYKDHSSSQYDPNLCSKWSSDCQGKECDSICHLKWDQ